MGTFDWETALNNDDSLYFCPVRHSILSPYKVKFEMYNSYIVASDAVLKGKPIILIEWTDEDEDRPATIGMIEHQSTIESMAEVLNATDSIYHDPIYQTIFGWAVDLFYK